MESKASNNADSIGSRIGFPGELKTRNSRLSKGDDRGNWRARIGSRNDLRTFKFPPTVSRKEFELRRQQLKQIYEICQGWNELSNYVADYVRKGITPIPVPRRISYEPLGVCDFEHIGAERERILLVQKFPFLSWASLCESKVTDSKLLGDMRKNAYERFLDSAKKFEQYDGVGLENALPISGTLHQALDAYRNHVELENSANHDRLTKIKQLIHRHEDMPLAVLRLDACRRLFDYWRQRPPRIDGTGQYSVKRSREQLSELVRFLSWLHLSEAFPNWKEPTDFSRLERSISKAGIKKKSILQSKMPVFSVTDLASLVRVAQMPEKFWIMWCLNTSHGAAEVGRVTWEDIYLNQDHPWIVEGLEIPSGGNWIGFFRPKTEVVGWWLLWDETVDLLLDWKAKCPSILGREVLPSDPVLLRGSGEPLFNDIAKNGQSGFYNAFERLKSKCHRLGLPVADLPPGTLRDQFPDWCGGNQSDDKVASLALGHGTPNSEDKLLYKHYSNKPWKRLFDRQMEFREYCRPVLDSLNEAPPLPPKVAALQELWSTLSSTGVKKIYEAADKLDVSFSTIYRYLKELGLRV